MFTLIGLKNNHCSSHHVGLPFTYIPYSECNTAAGVAVYMIIRCFDVLEVHTYHTYIRSNAKWISPGTSIYVDSGQAFSREAMRTTAVT